MSTLLGNYITPVPAQQRLGPRWFTGSADAIFQSLNLVYDESPTYVVVFGADHVYRMDPQQMVDQHIASGAGVTVAGIRVPKEQADQFGVIETAADGRTHRAASSRSRRTRPRSRATPTTSTPRWATTSSRPTSSSRRCASTPATTAPCTTWAATSSR